MTLSAQTPDTELVVLSEYTFDGPVPAGGQELVPARTGVTWWSAARTRRPGGNFYNTAFVVGPGGDIVFRQVKAVPIQFFKDGLPAPEQKLWDSPWGKIGICVCYDLSYTRVTDRLVKLGRPGADCADHGRDGLGPEPSTNCTRASPRSGRRNMASRSSAWPARASRNWLTARAGSWPRRLARATARTHCRDARTAGSGRLPLDRWLAPFAVGVTAASLLWRLVWRRRQQVAAATSPSPVASASEAL